MLQHPMETGAHVPGDKQHHGTGKLVTHDLSHYLPSNCIAKRSVILIHCKQLTLSYVALRHHSLPDSEIIIL